MHLTINTGHVTSEILMFLDHNSYDITQINITHLKGDQESENKMSASRQPKTCKYVFFGFFLTL